MDDATLAAELVRDAGLLAKRMLAEGLRTDYKTSISDVVSAADHAAEELITARLSAERPTDGLIGEEGARRPGDDRRWFVDPVDGTYNFLNGMPYWCSAVGLSDSDGPLVGAVYYPSVDELWVGGRGLPTARNGVPVPPLADRPLSAIAVCSYSHPADMDDERRRRCWQAVVSKAATVRMMGSASIDLASVSGGRLGLFLQSDLNEWDWLPGAALVCGAGGAAETVHAGGHRWHVAGNRGAVAEAITRLGEAA